MRPLLLKCSPWDTSMTKKEAIMKKTWTIPVNWEDDRKEFIVLGEVKIAEKVVGITYHLKNSTGGPKYSAAELRLFIARLEVAKENVIDHIDHHIAMFKAILEGAD